MGDNRNRKGKVMLTEADIRRVIGESVANFDATSLNPAASFSDAGLDSLDHASVLLALQEEYGLEVPDEDVDLCNSIESILAYQRKHFSQS